MWFVYVARIVQLCFLSSLLNQGIWFIPWTIWFYVWPFFIFDMVSYFTHTSEPIKIKSKCTRMLGLTNIRHRSQIYLTDYLYFLIRWLMQRAIILLYDALQQQGGQLQPEECIKVDQWRLCITQLSLWNPTTLTFLLTAEPNFCTTLILQLLLYNIFIT